MSEDKNTDTPTTNDSANSSSNGSGNGPANSSGEGNKSTDNKLPKKINNMNKEQVLFAISHAVRHNQKDSRHFGKLIERANYLGVSEIDNNCK